MVVFMLEVLPAQSTYVTVIEKNMYLDCGEYHPHQNGAQFSPVPKVQSRRVLLIAHPHNTAGASGPHAVPALTRASTLSPAASYSTSSATTVSPVYQS